MKHFIPIAILLSACTTAVTHQIPQIQFVSLSSSPIKIAVIDTGINLKNINVKICDHGLIDFTGTGIQDTHGHGQNIAHIIGSHLRGVNYCLYIIKFSEGQNSSRNASVKAFQKALTLKVDIINYSAGGEGDMPSEHKVIDALEKLDIPVIVAAGNDDRDLAKSCYYFPACYNNKNVFVVGSVDDEHNKAKSSNYGVGVIDFWWYGVNQDYGGYKFSGTSQATAHITGILARELAK
jgi:hypothetical protein